jgi:hypothetical protein
MAEEFQLVFLLYEMTFIFLSSLQNETSEHITKDRFANKYYFFCINKTVQLSSNLWHVKIIFHAVPACHGKPVLDNQLLNGGDSRLLSISFFSNSYRKGVRRSNFRRSKQEIKSFFFHLITAVFRRSKV